MNRRAFFGTTLGTTLGAIHAFGADQPRCAAPAGVNERLAVASYPFRKELDLKNATMKLVDFPAMVAQRFGVHGIEPLDEHFPTMDPLYLHEFNKAVEQAGAHVVNIPVGRLHGSFNDPDASKRKAAIETARKWIDVAALIKSPSVRVHIAPVQGVASDVPRTGEALAEVARYGASKGIVVNLENDDPASEEAFYIVGAIEKVNSPWLRALPDFCNSMLLNKGEDYNYRAMTAMFKHACNISHLKEIETDEGKTYRIDLKKTFGIAKAANYRGFYSVEWDSDGDPYAGTARLIQSARMILST